MHVTDLGVFSKEYTFDDAFCASEACSDIDGRSRKKKPAPFSLLE
jgi:hypothetical protein